MEHTILMSPAQRLAEAIANFQKVNQALPPGLPPFQLPPFTESVAGQDALVGLLIEKRLISEQEFVDAKTVRMAEVVEHLAGQARDAKRQALGLVVAQPGQAPH